MNNTPQEKSNVAPSMFAFAIAGPLAVFLIQVYVFKLLETLNVPLRFLEDLHPVFFALLPALGFVGGILLSAQRTAARKVVHAFISGGTATVFFVICDLLMINAGLAPDHRESRRNPHPGQGKEVFMILLAVFFFLGVVSYLTVQRMWNYRNSEHLENLSPLS